MPEPIKFKHLIPEMAGDREAIMVVARTQNQEALAGGAHPTTKALAVEHILEAIRMQLKAPLTKLLTAHINAVDEEYELMEGSCPAPGGADTVLHDLWRQGLFKAFGDALDGDVLSLVDPEALGDWILEEQPVEDLVDLILANIQDPANALAKCGITKEDVASLIVPAPIGEPRGVTAAVAAEREVLGVKSMSSPEFKLPTLPPGGKLVPGVHQGATRKRAPKLDGPTPVTAAAAAALTALIDHSAYKEADVAAALGVSRTQALNYRTGKTLWEPSDEQMAALRRLFAEAFVQLSMPLDELEGAWIE